MASILPTPPVLSPTSLPPTPLPPLPPLELLAASLLQVGEWEDDDDDVEDDDWGRVADQALKEGRDVREWWAEEMREREEEEDWEDELYISRAPDFLDLQTEITSSTTHLTQLRAFLSTFQTSLSSLSTQISTLQARSSQLDARLRSRRTVSSPLSVLLSDLAIPPSLIHTILNTDPSPSTLDAWLPALAALEARLDGVRARGGAKAVSDVEGVVEALRIKAAEKARAHLLALLHPIRVSIATNLPIHQTGALLRARPFYGFLRRRADRAAREVQRAYVNAARGYYETGFRRYAREVARVGARWVEKAGSVGEAWWVSEVVDEEGEGEERERYAQLDGPGVFLAYQSDQPTFKLPREALFRSLLLTFADNAHTEYAFVLRFFDDGLPAPLQPGAPRPGPFLSPEEVRIAQETGAGKAAEEVWGMVMEPALAQVRADLLRLPSPLPSPPTLLTQIRLNDHLSSLSHARGCVPLDSLHTSLRLALWPAFQTQMGVLIDSLKRLAESAAVAGAGGAAGLLGGAVGLVTGRRAVGKGEAERATRRYARLFAGLLGLASEEDEEMVFSSMARIRPHLETLVSSVAEHGLARGENKDVWLSATYESILQELSRSAGDGLESHERLQRESAHWREREERARRRIGAARR